MEILRLEIAVFLVHLSQWFVPWSGLLAGCAVLVVLNAWHAQKPQPADIGLVLLGLASLGLTLGLCLPLLTHALTGEYVVSLSLWRFLAWFLLFSCGLVSSLMYYRHGAAKLDHFRARFSKKTKLARDERTDIRTVADQLPPIDDYDPRPFYAPGRFFLGLDVHKSPVYWNGRLPHVAISGFSGAGKGKKLQDLAAQSIANDELLVYLDPKDDEWGAYAVYDACRRAGKPYHYLHLSPKQPPQFNLLEGAEDYEIEELFSAAFDLADKGGEADFYRANDRVAAYEAARLAASKHLTCAELWQEMGELFAKRAPGFLGKLHEVARVTAANAKADGLSLPSMLETGGAVYVVGSTTLQPVRRVQQMLFVRLLQLATARDRTTAPLKTVCIIADEAKYHISRPVLNGLGTARDKGVRVVVAFQSFADLRDVPDDLDAEAVIGSFTENTPCKLVYRLEDPETAELLAQKSGNKLVDDEIRHTEKNLFLAETVEKEGRMLRTMEAYFIDLNQLLSLPLGWGVVYGDGIAKLVKIGTYRVEKSPLAIQVQAVQGVALPQSTLTDLIAPNPLPNPLPPSNGVEKPVEEEKTARPKRTRRAVKPKAEPTPSPEATTTTPTLQDLI